jgi:hypothetical protein
MPFKDTPGLRRIAAAAIEARDVVCVRLVLPDWTFCDPDGVVHCEGETMLLQRRLADAFVERGYVELVD